MRALSLTAVAALVLLAACSDATAPPEAVDAQFAAATPSSPEIFNEWIPSTPYVFDGCGETFTYEGGMDHLIIREHVTPSGKYRWNYHIQTSAAMITSTSGGIYRANAGTGNGSILADTDGEKNVLTLTATIIAKGVNVDQRLKYKEQGKTVVLPSGEVLIDRFAIEVECR